mgnify:CR=1 FL=1
MLCLFVILRQRWRIWCLFHDSFCVLKFYNIGYNKTMTVSHLRLYMHLQLPSNFGFCFLTDFHWIQLGVAHQCAKYGRSHAWASESELHTLTWWCCWSYWVFYHTKEAISFIAVQNCLFFCFLYCKEERDVCKVGSRNHNKWLILWCYGKCYRS